MYNFYIAYAGGDFNEYEHIVSVSYIDYDKEKTITQNDIATHNFPIRVDLWLRSKNSSYAISGENIRTIEIRKE